MTAPSPFASELKSRVYLKQRLAAEKAEFEAFLREMEWEETPQRRAPMFSIPSPTILPGPESRNGKFRSVVHKYLKERNPNAKKGKTYSFKEGTKEMMEEYSKTGDGDFLAPIAKKDVDHIQKIMSELDDMVAPGPDGKVQIQYFGKKDGPGIAFYDDLKLKGKKHDIIATNPSDLRGDIDAFRGDQVHEMGHALEFNHPKLKNLREAWAKQKTDGVSWHEVVADAGNGKTYVIRYYHVPAVKDYAWAEYGGLPVGVELVSVGLEFMWRNPMSLFKSDEEHFYFIMMVMRGVI